MTKVEKYRKFLKVLSETPYITDTTNDNLREIMGYISKKLNISTKEMSNEMGYKAYSTINRWYRGNDFTTTMPISNMAKYLLTQLELWQKVNRKKK